MRQGIVIIAISVGIHLLLWAVFSEFAAQPPPTYRPQPAPTVLQVQVAPAPTPVRILEADQQETAPPKQARFLGRTNHQAKVATKATPRRQLRAAAGKLMPQRSIIVTSEGNTPKLTYAQFLQQSQQSLNNADGYQDFIPDKMASGDVIDISTSEYRYIGYFSGLRQAIELAWHYPASAAQRGQQGVVRLRFAIAADGTASHIKVTKSSGYRVLDVAIVEAIRLASPFSPLPRSLKRDQLTITGSFHYILRGI